MAQGTIDGSSSQTPLRAHLAQKCRLVADQIRGLPVAQALQDPRVQPQEGRADGAQVLESAMANAEHNHGADIDELKVSNVQSTARPRSRAIRRVRSRSDRILKRNSHITIRVGDE
jgi:large subunit ribosomal protein L22